MAGLSGNGFGSGLRDGGESLSYGGDTAVKWGSGRRAVTGVIGDPSAPLERYNPQDPDAGADGYVAYPDINPLTEMVDLMGARGRTG